MNKGAEGLGHVFGTHARFPFHAGASEGYPQVIGLHNGKTGLFVAVRAAFVSPSLRIVDEINRLFEFLGNDPAIT